jgi:TolA-binding protein
MTRARQPSSADPEDLSVRARKGSLSEAERPALERALAANQTLAVAHQVGTDFDRIGQVRSGDDELVARLADLTLTSSRPRARFALARRRLLLGLAAALTVAGSAAAWRGAALLRSAPPTPSLAAPAAKPTSAARVTRLDTAVGVKPALAVAPLPAPDPVATTLPAASVGVGLSADSAVSNATLPHSVEDAAALFREATAARRSSDFGRARQLYLRLEHDFPGSEEAQLAPVSLGKVLLVMGRAGEAERQFSLYSSSGGTLSEEALVGQAQSLARLGRASDEQKVWQRLLQDFPRSLYAGEANQRLSALAAAPAR